MVAFAEVGYMRIEHTGNDSRSLPLHLERCNCMGYGRAWGSYSRDEGGLDDVIFVERICFQAPLCARWTFLSVMIRLVEGMQPVMDCA